MILLAWLLGLLVGFMSVFSGIYTTSQAMDTHEEQPDHCEFEVGKERLNYKINSLWLNIIFLVAQQLNMSSCFFVFVSCPIQIKPNVFIQSQNGK